MASYLREIHQSLPFHRKIGEIYDSSTSVLSGRRRQCASGSESARERGARNPDTGHYARSRGILMTSYQRRSATATAIPIAWTLPVPDKVLHFPESRPAVLRMANERIVTYSPDRSLIRQNNPRQQCG